MDEARQNAEQSFLVSVLDALPAPTALLNRDGDTVYTNDRPCPVELAAVEFGAIPAVQTALDGVNQSAVRVLLRGGAATCPGLLETYPLLDDDDACIGALCMFRPDFAASRGDISALPTLSPAMQTAWETIRRLSFLSASALFVGETGVGKSDFARALHRLGQRDLPFETVNPDASPDALCAFAKVAAGGTLFCQRIDLWNANLLDALTTIIKSRTVTTSDGNAVPFRARLTASAAPTIAGRAASGLFPPEIYQKLAAMPVQLPPLRDRKEDIFPAAKHLLHEIKPDCPGFDPACEAVFLAHPWFGNVLELHRTIEDAAAKSPDGEPLTPERFDGFGTQSGSFRKMRKTLAQEQIHTLLELYGYGVAGKRRAAEELGISIATLYRMLGSKKNKLP